MDQERIVAIALLTKHDLGLLGPAFSRAWPVDDKPAFGRLLGEIDQADRETRRSSAPPRGK